MVLQCTLLAVISLKSVLFTKKNFNLLTTWNHNLILFINMLFNNDVHACKEQPFNCQTSSEQQSRL